MPDMLARFTPRNSQVPLLLLFVALLLIPLSASTAADTAEIERRLDALRTEIRHHDYLYYVKGQPEISDAAYDQLFQQLVDLEKEYPALITPDSPTQRVGGQPLAEFVTARHTIPMLSLNKCTNSAGLRQFHSSVVQVAGHDDILYVLEPKIDGVAVSLIYRNGRLSRALTRGDGNTGNDVTANIRTIGCIPLVLQSSNPPELLEVRGEIYISQSGLEWLNRQRRGRGEPAFATARNAAAGSLHLLDPAAVANRPLAALFYGCGTVNGVTIHSQSELLARLSALGFPVPSAVAKARGRDELVEQADILKRRCQTLDFDTDGVVVKVDSFALRERLGTGNRAPNWAIAYKFSPPKAATRLRSVMWTVGRTGILTPIAVFDPVELDGTRIDRASLHSPAQITELDLRIGDTITVAKAGAVIPQVTGADKQARDGSEDVIKPPQNCPACDSHLDTRSGLRCTNQDCPARRRQMLLHFARAMNINGLGERWVERLLLLKPHFTCADLYTLTEHQKKQLLGQKGVGKTSLGKVLHSIDTSRKREPWRLLYSLGIPGVGATTARALIHEFGSVELAAAATTARLLQVEGIGPEIAEELIVFWESDDNRQLLQRLHMAGLPVTE